MLTVGSCCCGCSLRTGTWIIFILNLVVGVGLIFRTDWDQVSGGNILYTVLYFLLIAIVIGGNIIGIYGIVTEKPACFIPSLAVEGLLMVVMICVMIAVAIDGRAVMPYLGIDKSMMSNEVQLKTNTIVVEITYLILLSLHAYFFIVVRSFYMELNDEI